MTNTLFRKSVILKDFDIHKDLRNNRVPLSKGLDISHKQMENKEDYATLVGTKQQINTYLQEAPVLSDRLRTLNALPKYRIINSHRVRIQ